GFDEAYAALWKHFKSELIVAGPSSGLSAPFPRASPRPTGPDAHPTTPFVLHRLMKYQKHTNGKGRSYEAIAENTRSGGEAPRRRPRLAAAIAAPVPARRRLRGDQASDHHLQVQAGRVHQRSVRCRAARVRANPCPSGSRSAHARGN